MAHGQGISNSSFDLSESRSVQPEEETADEGAGKHTETDANSDGEPISTSADPVSVQGRVAEGLDGSHEPFSQFPSEKRIDLRPEDAAPDDTRSDRLPNVGEDHISRRRPDRPRVTSALLSLTGFARGMWSLQWVGRRLFEGRSPQSGAEMPTRPSISSTIPIDVYEDGTGDPSWKCIGVSALGTSHVRMKTACQDANAKRRLKNGLLVMAVADGAGSAPYSAEGASLAVSVAVDTLQVRLRQGIPANDSIWTLVMTEVFQEASAAVRHCALINGRSPRAYATTLLTAVVSDTWIAYGMVGDGALVILDRDGGFHCLTTPQRGEYANTTYFITRKHMSEYLAVEYRQTQIQGVAALTDGLLNLSVSNRNNTPFTCFFDPLFKFLEATPSEQRATEGLSRFMISEKINRRTDDDKTLVLALNKTIA